MTEDGVSELEKQLRETEEAYAQLLNEHKELQGRCGELEQSIELSQYQPRELLLKILKAITPCNRRVDETAFDEWQRGITNPLKQRIGELESNLKVIRGFAFEAPLQLTMRASRLKERPFVYFDFANQGIFYTPSTLEFLGISEHEVPNFSGLLDYIGRDGRRCILHSLKEDVQWYYVNSTTEKGVEIKMATLPFTYGERAVGAGTLFSEPNYSDRKLKHYKRAVENAAEVLRELGDKMQGELK